LELERFLPNLIEEACSVGFYENCGREQCDERLKFIEMAEVRFRAGKAKLKIGIWARISTI
jgi:hypothetical protein